MAQAPPRNLGRISEIAQAAVRHGFGYFFERHRLGDLVPFRGRVPLDGDEPSLRGQHLRELLDELGPTFVKFGQLLSMRPDILPPDIIAELRGLQDDVRPFAYEEVERTIREELGLSIEQLYAEFDERPLAAASIGQVHRAVLPNGRRVAVKVQRPGAPAQIEADLALMYQAAKIAKERVRALDFIDARGLVDEFSRSIRQELDYRLEARNAERFRHDFAGHPHVQVPRVYWSYTRARVLTLEFLEGTQLADVDLLGYGLDERRRLATVITETWMAMIFRQRLLPRRPAPGEHPRALAGSDRARRLRAHGQAHRRRPDEGDAALHRRRERERRRASAPARRPRRRATRRRSRSSSAPSCASSSTATTAPASPRSIRSR